MPADEADYRRAALIVSAAFLPMVLGLALDGVVDPILVWGGRICPSPTRGSVRCLVPPYLLLIISVALMEVAERLASPE